MHILVKTILLISLFGCSATTISTSGPFLPKKGKIVLLAFDNFTDTSQAGKRAANILEGILLSRGYSVISLVKKDTQNLPLIQKVNLAKKYKANYLILGGVSEWRYKAGIDVEPAISLNIKVINLKTHKIVWSSAGSNSEKGSTSLGVSAQKLISKMIL